MLYFKAQTQKLKDRIAELEASLLKQYVPQSEVSKTFDLLIKHRQDAFWDVYSSLVDFDVHDCKRVLKLI